MKSTVGKNIVKSRKEQGMSQEQLAQKLHVTRQAVSNWETGRSQPGLDMLEALAGAFGTDILVVIYGQMPAGEDEETRSAARRRHLVKAAAWGILTLALYFILAALGRYLDELRTRTYNSMPYMLLQTCLIPPVSAGAAISLMHVLNVPGCGDIRTICEKKTPGIRRTVYRSLPALYAVAVFPPSIACGRPIVDMAAVLFHFPACPVLFHWNALLPWV